MTAINTLFNTPSRVAPANTPTSPLLADSRTLVGIEVEVEGVPTSRDVAGFNRHHDGSLRDGIEFVFEAPKSGANIIRALDNLASFFENNPPSTNERTSTHIHVNMTDGATVSTARSLLALVYLIEPGIYRFGDEGRKWCNYCQPLTDMEPERLASLMGGDDTAFSRAAYGGRHSSRYYGLNLRALSSHGTAEFRYFPGWRSKETTIAWINLVIETRRAADALGVEDILSAAESVQDFADMLARHMPLTGASVLAGLDMDEVTARAHRLRGIADTITADTPAAPRRIHPVSLDPNSSLGRALANVLGIRVGTAIISGATIAEILTSPGALDYETRCALAHVLEHSGQEAVAAALHEYYASL